MEDRRIMTTRIVSTEREEVWQTRRISTGSKRFWPSRFETDIRSRRWRKTHGSSSCKPGACAACWRPGDGDQPYLRCATRPRLRSVDRSGSNRPVVGTARLQHHHLLNGGADRGRVEVHHAWTRRHELSERDSL